VAVSEARTWGWHVPRQNLERCTRSNTLVLDGSTELVTWLDTEGILVLWYLTLIPFEEKTNM
jgi:hypothetical protein